MARTKRIQELTVAIRCHLSQNAWGLPLLSERELRCLTETLAEENKIAALALDGIIVQRSTFRSSSEDLNIISSFQREESGNTAMEIVVDSAGRRTLFIFIDTVRRRMRSAEEIRSTTMRSCRSYEDCFRNRLRHEFGHCRHLDMGDAAMENLLREISPVSEYATKNCHEAFAEAYSVGRISIR
jgi:hypothetical protein